jgi:TonB family protein
MIVQWMLHIAVVSAMLTVGALATERALRLWRWQARLVWMAAMTLSLGLPLVSLAQALGWIPSLDHLATVPAAITAPLAVLLPSVSVSSSATTAGVIVAIVWAVVTVALTIRFMTAARALGRRRQAWRSATVDGQSVLVSRDAGPAVIGFRTPTIVLPEWVLTLDAPLRELVLRHEREHLERGDPRLLIGAVAVAVLAPWNPAVWFQLYRLRCAMELDCDLRVLRAYPDVRKYGSLLLAVAQRADRGELLAAALTESTSLLGRRIRAMRQPTSRYRIALTYCLAAAAVVVTIVACEMKSPSTPEVAPTSPTAARAAPVVNNGPYFEFQVEEPVRPIAGTSQPRYPDALRMVGVEGEVLAQFIVGPDGRADVQTLKILKSSNELFTDAIRNALPEMRFTPARVGGKAVHQLVQEPFSFSISR